MPAVLAIPAAQKAVKVAEKLPVIGGAVNSVETFFASSDPAKDRNRNATTDAAYNKAVAGDVNAIAFVHARGGQMGTANIPGYGEIGGWGSAVAKDYARKKYAALVAMPALASAIAQADALLRGGQAPAGSVTDALTRTVVGTDIPIWLILVGLAILVGGLVLLYRRR